MADKKCTECEKVVEVKINAKKQRFWTCSKDNGGCGAWGLLPKNANTETTQTRTPSGKQKPEGQGPANSKAGEKNNKDDSTGGGTGSESGEEDESGKTPWYDRPLF